MVVNVSPGSSLFIGGDTNTRIVSRLDTGRAELVKFNLIAGQDISGPSQLIDLELKYNYYSGGQLTSAASVQKVLLPVKGGTATRQGTYGTSEFRPAVSDYFKTGKYRHSQRNTESYSYL